MRAIRAVYQRGAGPGVGRWRARSGLVAALPDVVQEGGFIRLTGRRARRAMADTAANSQVNLIKAGLEDAVVSTSEICFIDGQKGRLLYRGFDVDDLAAQSTFEETVYLLWYGHLPTRKELDTLTKALSATANRKLPHKLIEMLRLF